MNIEGFFEELTDCQFLKKDSMELINSVHSDAVQIVVLLPQWLLMTITLP
jgi:hypothetical protein